MDSLAAVLMAGGLGTRMKSSVPKHFHELLGSSRRAATQAQTRSSSSRRRQRATASTKSR
jgi:bifunctional N-acetylglucosamine-1-phosphate-uridyltransferase/glucosamine-1-phosphate-acetyltransferase GlmU-like protein